MTITLSTEIDIAAPAPATWAVVADYGRDPEWRAGVVTMAPSPDGEVALGTTTAEVLRLGGRTYRNGGVVTAVEPGRSFTWRTTSGADAAGSRSVVALDGDRCRLRLELRVNPHGTERLLAPVLRRMLARNLAADARRLAALVTSAVPA